MNRGARKQDRGRAPAKADAPAPPPANIAALLQRFPKQTPAQLFARVAVAVAVAVLGLWGILAANWDVAAVLVFFAIEFATVIVLNWLAIAFLPMHLEAGDRTVIKGWAWLAGVVAVGLVAYSVIEGEAGRRVLFDWVRHAAGDGHEFLVARGMLLSAVVLVLVHVSGLGFDIAYWRRQGGAFRYWSGTVFVMRMWFVLAFGLFFWFFGFVAGLNDDRRGAVILLWVLFVAADLFALWLPIAVRRKVEREKIA